MGTVPSFERIVIVNDSVEPISLSSNTSYLENIPNKEALGIETAEPSNVINKIHDILSIRDTAKLQDCLTSLSTIHVGKVDPLKHDAIAKYQSEVGKKLAETKTTRKICRVIVDIWFEDSTNKQGDVSPGRNSLLMEALSLLTSYTDNSTEVAHDVVRETDFLETLKEILMSGHERDTILSLCIINNVAKFDDNVARIRSLDFVSTFSSFLVNKNDGIRLMTLSALANIINEEESAILQDKHDLMKLLLRVLNAALNNKTSHAWVDPINSTTWSAQETARTVRLLARNDANKQLLVKMGSLPPLCTMAASETVDEQREAVGAICILAFDEENQKKIIMSDKPDIVRLLFHLKENSADEQVQKDADCTLLTLLEKIQTCDKYNDIACSYEKRLKVSETHEENENIHKGSEIKNKGHVMISYNKDHREQLQRIQSELEKKGYRTWMDVTDMRGNSFDQMAAAVESARIVLICLSQAYKESPYCRLEAKYAWKRKKNILPLLMVNGYEPDGWLGLILEDAIYYDFSGKYKFELKLEALLKEIKELYTEGDKIHEH